MVELIPNDYICRHQKGFLLHLHFQAVKESEVH